jgi:hypothetical protein
MQPSQFPNYRAAFENLMHLVDSFQRTLPPISRLNPSDAPARTIILSHALLYGAIIRVHSQFASELSSRQECLSAARSMLRLSGSVNMQEIGCLNPIMGVRIYRSCIKPNSYCFICSLCTDIMDASLSGLHPGNLSFSLFTYVHGLVLNVPLESKLTNGLRQCKRDRASEQPSNRLERSELFRFGKRVDE